MAQQTPGGYGFIAPWGTEGPDGQIVAPSLYSVGGSDSVVGLGEPIDPLTGLPIRMTSLASSNGSGSAPAIADNTPNVPQPINAPATLPRAPLTHRSDNAQPAAGQIHMQRPAPGPVLRTGVMLPALPAPAENPLIPRSIIDPFQHQTLYQNRARVYSPASLGGGIEFSNNAGGLSFPTLPQPIPMTPPPRRDSHLFDMGDRNSEIDWINLIDEYAGRATRSDIPLNPVFTHPQDRYWLRVDHWRADATSTVSSSSRFGLATFFADATIGLGKIRGVTITPSASLHQGLGTDRTRLEERLYDFQVKVAWMHQLDEHWRMRFEFGAGLYSDFDIQDDLDALRFTGQSLFTFEWSRDLQLVLGAAYLNLETQEIYPIAGIVWQPSDQLQMKMVFPEWKVSGFVREVRDGEIWSYLGGGFYGRTWRVQRTAGFEDDATFSNWRAHVGWEKRHISGMTWFGEIGYEFARRLRYRSKVGDFDADEVAFARVGINY